MHVRTCEHYTFPLLGCFCTATPGAPLPPASCPHCGCCAGVGVGVGDGGDGVSGGGGGGDGVSGGGVGSDGVSGGGVGSDGVSGGGVGGGTSGGGAAAAPLQLIQLQFVGEGFLKHQVRGPSVACRRTRGRAGRTLLWGLWREWALLGPLSPSPSRQIDRQAGRQITPPPPSTCVRRLLPSQVRRLVGLLVRIGLGEEEEPVEVVHAALDEPGTFDRRRAPTARAEGLWLECVELS